MGAIVLALVVAAVPAHSRCNANVITQTLKHIEIADYEPSATSPPPLVVADLYALAAHNVEQCAGAALHYMDSRIGDLLQAATYAKFAALAYFEGQKPSRACSMLSEAERDNTAAMALGTGASSSDRRFLQAARVNEASIRQLFASRCR